LITSRIIHKIGSGDIHGAPASYSPRGGGYLRKRGIRACISVYYEYDV